MVFARKVLSSLIVLALSSHTVNAFTYADDFVDFEESLADFYGDDEFISLATGSKKLIKKAPSVASVITAEDIRNMGARNLSEVLDTVPGLHVSKSGQNMAPEFWFRGISTTFTPQTLFMVNGTSTKSVVRGDNHTVWGEYPIHAIERIEVIRGPGSALYGADAFSGVINIITKKADKNRANEVGAKVGSFNTVNTWFNTQLELGNWQFSANFEYLSSDGYDGMIDADAQSALDAASAPNSIQPVSLAPGHVNVGFDAIDIWLSAENELFNVDLGFQERSDVETGQGALEAIDDQGNSSGNKHIVNIALKEIEFLPEYFATVKASYYGSSQSIDEDLRLLPPGTFSGAFPDGLIGNPGWEEETTHIELNTKYRGFDSTEISFGTGYERQNLYKVTESKNFFADFSPRPNGVEDVSDTAETFLPEADRESYFMYIQGVMQLAADWELTAGGRYDNYTDIGSAINPRLALVWSTSLNLTTKFLYGRAFRAPSFAELLTLNNPVALGNIELTPENIDTIELAFTYRYSPELSMDFNFYKYKIDDLITFVQNGNTGTATAQNQGERTGSGFEAHLIYHYQDNIVLRSNIAYVKAEDTIVNGNVGEHPSLQMYARVEWQINERLKLNSQISHIANRARVPGDVRAELNDYTLVNVTANYQFPSSDVALEFSVVNLFDDDIREPSSANVTAGKINIPNDLPQAERSVYLAISKTF
ncbi:TonB-dependent receptor plug domain-containing protein [Cognaticolwellia mytili]|uniref:TonB-dependent receptor plug domain-containing protein n=1 Tax=Cognaticolwellia mytili TaxID=1888913 RepID=UPI000A174C68|nr:TonB-dependent receptor [Cognaticolwellia mytili]